MEERRGRVCKGEARPARTVAGAKAKHLDSERRGQACRVYRGRLWGDGANIELQACPGVGCAGCGAQL